MLTQYLLNGIIAGSSYALVAVGFALIYNTVRIFHFAHGAVYVLSAYLFYTLRVQLGVSFLPAFLSALALSVACGTLLDEVVYSPLAKRRASLLVQMLSSIGLYIVIVNLVALVYGNETILLVAGAEPTFAIGSAVITRIQLATLVTFVVAFGAVLLFLRKTRLGCVIRAMRDGPEFLTAMGFSPQRVRRVVFGAGSGLAAIGGILKGLDVGIDPHVGMNAVLFSAIAVIIGGVGFFGGAAAGAMVLGVSQSIVVWQTSHRWQEAITYALLILFMLLRPEGIFGSRRRVEEVTL